jgi:hypothetical protein
MSDDVARSFYRALGGSLARVSVNEFMKDYEKLRLSEEDLQQSIFNGLETSDSDLFQINITEQDSLLMKGVSNTINYNLKGFFNELRDNLLKDSEYIFKQEYEACNNDPVQYAEKKYKSGVMSRLDYLCIIDPPHARPSLEFQVRDSHDENFKKSEEYLHLEKCEKRVDFIQGNTLLKREFLEVKSGEHDKKADYDTINLIANLPANEKGYLQYIRQHPNPKIQSFFNRSLNVEISAKSREKHTYILAKSGSGKSELMKALIYGDILTRKSSIILIDPHGDLADQIAFFKPDIFQNGADDVVYIDPTLKNDLSPSINPFDIPFSNENELARNTQEILNILEVLLKGSDTTAQMSAILEPCIAVLLRAKNASFEDLQRFMDDTENADLVALGKKSPNKQHAKIFNAKFQSKQYETTRNGLYTRMQLLLNDPIFQNLISNKTTLNLNQLIEEKKIIIFRLSLGKGGSRSMEAFGRFVVGMVRIIALQRESIPESQRTHTHLYIDEVQNFITEDLESVLNQLRKYKVFLTSANQLSNQGYSSGLQKALFSSEVLIMGKNEAKTAREVGSQLNISQQEIQDLSVGNFYLRIGNNEAVKMKVSTQLMQSSYRASKEEIKALINNSVKKYYTPINQDSSDLKQEIEQSQNTTNNQSFSPKFKL